MLVPGAHDTIHAVSMVLEENAVLSEGSNTSEQYAQDPRKQGTTNQRLKQNGHI